MVLMVFLVVRKVYRFRDEVKVSQVFNLMLDPLQLVGLTVTYAIIDSVDPCIYALYIALLAPIAVNMRKLVSTAVCFILSVFIGYLLFNAILRFVLGALSLPRWILSLVLIVYGLLVILYTYQSSRVDNEDVCREDRPLCKLLNILRVKPSTLGLSGIAVLGFIASFTILPCSAGMALVFNITMRSYGFLTWIPLAILYTAIFVLPLIALTLMVIGLTRIGLTYKMILKNQKWVKIGGGMLMVCVAVLLSLGVL